MLLEGVDDCCKCLGFLSVFDHDERVDEEDVVEMNLMLQPRDR